MRTNLIHLMVATSVFLVACDDETDSTTNTNTDGASSSVQVDASPMDAEGNAPPAPSEVVGYYSGQWGDMALRLVGEEIWGAYPHEQGTIVGRYVDGVLVGWWSEVPSRLPPGDAGEIEFRFTRVGNVIKIDGRWRYGSEQAWREDWDMDQVNAEPPSNLLERFNTPAGFMRHP